jgi:hypothetical protein
MLYGNPATHHEHIEDNSKDVSLYRERKGAHE